MFVFVRCSVQHSLGITKRTAPQQQNHCVIRTQHLLCSQAWKTGEEEAGKIHGRMERKTEEQLSMAQGGLWSRLENHQDIDTGTPGLF